MEDYQARVIYEYEALVAKVTKLASFLANDATQKVAKLSHEDLLLLKAQMHAMRSYEHCLVMRLHSWFPHEY